MALNLDDDMDIFDYLQQGIYLVREPDESFTEYPCVTCLRRVVRKTGQAVSVSQVQQDQTTWHAKVDDFPCDVVPKFRDRIQDELGDQWFVQRIEIETLGTRYRFLCNKVKTPA